MACEVAQLTHQSSPEAVVAWVRSTLKAGADVVLSKWTALGQAPDGFTLLECSEQNLKEDLGLEDLNVRKRLMYALERIKLAATPHDAKRALGISKGQPLAAIENQMPAQEAAAEGEPPAGRGRRQGRRGAAAAAGPSAGTAAAAGGTGAVPSPGGGNVARRSTRHAARQAVLQGGTAAARSAPGADHVAEASDDSATASDDGDDSDFNPADEVPRQDDKGAAAPVADAVMGDAADDGTAAVAEAAEAALAAARPVVFDYPRPAGPDTRHYTLEYCKEKAAEQLQLLLRGMPLTELNALVGALPRYFPEPNEIKLRNKRKTICKYEKTFEIVKVPRTHTDMIKVITMALLPHISNPAARQRQRGKVAASSKWDACSKKEGVEKLLLRMAKVPEAAAAMGRYVRKNFSAHPAIAADGSNLVDVIMSLWRTPREPQCPPVCAVGVRTLELSPYHVDREGVTIRKSGTLEQFLSHIERRELRLPGNAFSGASFKQAHLWLQNAAQLLDSQASSSYELKEERHRNNKLRVYAEITIKFKTRSVFGFAKQQLPDEGADNDDGCDSEDEAAQAAKAKGDAAAAAGGTQQRAGGPAVKPEPGLNDNQRAGPMDWEEADVDAIMNEGELDRTLAKGNCDLGLLLSELDNFKGSPALAHAAQLKEEFDALVKQLEEADIGDAPDPSLFGRVTASGRQFNALLANNERNAFRLPHSAQVVLDDKLKLPLKPYQKSALAMMMQREAGRGSGEQLWVELSVPEQDPWAPAVRYQEEADRPEDQYDNHRDEEEDSNDDDGGVGGSSVLRSGRRYMTSARRYADDDEDEDDYGDGPYGYGVARRGTPNSGARKRSRTGPGSAGPQAKLSRAQRAELREQRAAAADAEKPRPYLRVFYSPILNMIAWDTSMKRLATGNNRLRLSNQKGGYNWLEVGLGKTACMLGLMVQTIAASEKAATAQQQAAAAAPGPSQPQPRTAHAAAGRAYDDGASTDDDGDEVGLGPVGSIVVPQGPKRDWRDDLLCDLDTCTPSHLVKGGTLVIVNTNLIGQWKIEVEKFIRNSDETLRVGHLMAEAKYRSSWVQVPADAAQYHIVLATPDKAKAERGLLRSVLWQRVILDEAHQDDGAVKLVTELPAVTKWLMTGTPLGRKLSEVSNMMAMLGLPRMRLLGISVHLLGWALGHSAIRYTKDGTSIDGTTNLVLPGYDAKTVKVKWGRADAEEYLQLWKSQYVELKKYKSEIAKNVAAKKAAEQEGRDHGMKVFDYTFNHMTVQQKLVLPLRQACAGGVKVDMPPKRSYELNNDAAVKIFGRIGEDAILEDDDSADEGDELLSVGAGLPPGEADLGDDETEEEYLARRKQAGGLWCFTSKIRGLVSDLLERKRGHPEDKVLIFSSFPDTLKTVAAALKPHGFKFRTMTSGTTAAAKEKALRDFLHDPPTTIFLLHAAVAATGLTLTVANHMYIMEPSLNPALEAQAIGRANRLGQTQRVSVTHMVMEGSVEQQIRKLMKERAQANTLSALTSAGVERVGAFNKGGKGKKSSGAAASELEGMAKNMSQEELESLLK